MKDKKKSSNNAAIGYNYETDEPIQETAKPDLNSIDEKADDEDSDIDLGIINSYNYSYCYELFV